MFSLLKTSRQAWSLMAMVAAIFFAVPASSHAQLSKGHQILIDRGFQIMGMTHPDNYFSLETYTNAGYTTVGFSFDSTGNLGPISRFTGDAPGFPWARWAPDETKMPGQGTGQTDNEGPYSRTNEIPHLSQLVALQLHDEWQFDQYPDLLERLVNWFTAERTNWPTTILYHNNWGYQITDAALVDYLNRAQPDMLSFDTYPWQSVWDENAPNHIGPVIPGPGSFQLKQWYSQLRQYREYARAYGIPMAIWRQTWHGVQDYDHHVYRDPSPSELRLNTFGALAFSVKFLNDFTYNTSSGSLFTKIFNGSGDTQMNTNGLYAEIAEVNSRVKKWGNTLVRLTPISTEGIPNYTTSVMFLRGKNAGGGLSTIPDGFMGDLDNGGGNATYTDWVYQRNDPYLTNNWGVTNKGSKNNGHPGDVIVSWFKPLDESFDGPDHTNEVYVMVVNGLTDPTGPAADCLQEITLNFHSSLAAVEMLNPLTGAVELQWLPLTNGFRQLVLNLNGGDAVLFKFPNGAPFVGVPSSTMTGPPTLTIHPASRENVLGTDSTFTAHAVGSASLSYQWQFNRVNIPGATANTYTRTNVQFADAGSYTVIVSNSQGTVRSMPGDLSVVASRPFFYEPFNYSNLGEPVSANTPANWMFGGSGVNDLNVTDGSLSYPGLTTSIGNSVTNGGVGLGVRRLIGTNVNSGTLYFSALFRMNHLGYGLGGWNGAASQVGAFFASDNTSSRFQIMVRSNSPSSYVFGVQKGGTGVSATFETVERTANATVLLVGKYDFTTTPNTVTLWINPQSSALGTGLPPTNSISATTGIDGLTINRFNFRQNVASGANSVPAAMQWDELRIGNSWADVTPVRLSLQTSLTGFVQLSDGRFQFGYSTASSQNGSVYASTNLVDWIPVGTPIEMEPGLYQFDDANSSNHVHRFYQLRSP